MGDMRPTSFLSGAAVCPRRPTILWFTSYEQVYA